MRPFLALPCVAFLLPSVATAGQVLIVGPGQPYTTIQSAIDAAVDRDTVLIMPGNYNGFVVDDKALAIVSDTSGQAFVSGAVQVQNLSSGKLVVLARLQATGSSNATYALQTAQNSGRILAERCTFRGATGDPQHPTLAGVGARVELDTDTELIACTLLGGHANPSTFSLAGRSALEVQSSAIRMYGCELTGGRGTTQNDDHGAFGGPGGNGVTIFQGDAITVGCTIQGGFGSAGGYDDSIFCEPGGNGGNGGAGVWLGTLPNQFATIEWRACSILGGAGGNGGGSSCGHAGSHGAPGDAIHLVLGESTPLLGPARYLYGIPLARENNLASVSAHGYPGDLVYVDLQGLPAGHGSNVVKPSHPVVWQPSNRVFLGVIDATGLLDATIPFGDLGPGVQSRTWMLRPTFVDTQGIEHSGNDFALILLDQQF